MIFARNRKAYHDYEMIEEFDAGLVLAGTEVKSIRAGHVNINDAHIRIINQEAFLINCHISTYNEGNINNHEPLRTRKLLLTRRQLNYLTGKVKEQGLALIPLKLFAKNRRIKLSMGLAKGKKLYDKRRDAKDKDMKREMERAFKNRNKGE